MRLPLIISLLLIGFKSISQTNCDFQIKADTTICGPGEIDLWVSGNNLEKVKWFGNNIITDDTLNNITVDISDSSTFYVTNRILHPINLIKNGDFELGNQDFTSKYWSSCLDGAMPQGSYCISNNSNTYWPSWAGCSDRKNPGTGLMFVTDGAITADEEIWCQTVNVDQNTDYALSTWITSVLNFENAILQFTINGDTLGDKFQASPVECEWNEFFEVWNSDLNTSAEICITNENTASDGNDFAFDDIEFNKVCYTIDSITVTVVDPITFSINSDTTICPGDDVNVAADTTYSNDYDYLWSTGETTQSINVDNIGTYELTISHPGGCEWKDEMTINPIANPNSNLISDTTVCLSIKGGIELNPGIANWTVWNTPNGIDTSSSFFATIPGLYEVSMYNGTNCFVSDRVEINEFCATQLFIPNAFTPNGDDINESWGAEAVEVYYFHLRVYNRFGDMFFETYDLNEKWNGNRAPQGTYTYLLDYRQIDPAEGVLTDYNKIGTVSLIR